ncbi:MAG: BolA family transcriptional regulator [Planctomycetes bacterium]|nr:BolA family transcriptional regulator [Planctomycetota bacterium]
MVMQKEQIEILVEDGLGEAICKARDLTGTEDHWGLEITWAGFEGLSRLEAHKAVLQVLRPHMDEGSGEIHAVQITTRLPEA